MLTHLMNRFPTALTLATCALLATCTLIVAPPATATMHAPDKLEQRGKYLEAKKALRQGKRTRYVRLKKQLHNYELLPYLEYAELTRTLKTQPNKRILEFIANNKELAIANRLQGRWLKHIGRQRQWDTLLTHYREDLADTSLKCYQLRARLQKQDKASVWPETAELWVRPRSQPKSCDSLFAQWIKAGQQTDAHKRERFRLAISKNNVSLANYVMGLMNAKDQRDAKKFLKLHRNPRLALKKGHFAAKTQADADIAAHALRRIARRDTLRVMRRFTELKPQLPFRPDMAAELQKSVGFHILSRPSREGLLWLQDQLEDSVDQDVAIYAARVSLLFEDWAGVQKAIEFLPQEIKDKQRWQYWNTRAQIQQDPSLDTEWKKAQLEKLAEQRDFYGFLAATELGQTFKLNDEALTFGPKFIDSLAQHPGLSVALELYAVGEETSAKREWRHALLDAPIEQQIASAHLARDWGWTSQSVYSTIMARSWNELSLRFPLAYQEYMLRGARQGGIELSWAYAIARQESAMNPSAISHAGAKGLMQLMPATARETIRKHSLPIRTPNLLDEKDNALIASTHLGELSRKYGGNRILASAAYNAGKHRADSWLSRNKNAQSFDVWIETIPFKETRNYVQNVLMFSAIYNYRMNDDVVFVKPTEWVIKPGALHTVSRP